MKESLFGSSFKNPLVDNPSIEIYVDGSYKDECVSYAYIILRNGKLLKIKVGTIHDQDVKQHRQIGGELYALGYALRWCQENHITSVTVYYDYEGLEAWATGRWKAKTTLTKRYQTFIQKMPIQIQWRKVKSHSGNHWNEQTDRLAKLACDPYPLFQPFFKFLQEHLLPVQLRFKSSHRTPPVFEVLYCSPSSSAPIPLQMEVAFPNLFIHSPPSFPQTEKERIQHLWHIFLKNTAFRFPP